MVTVSLCMIVKNEEEVLDRCLGSVADLVDEIVIVDTGSTDRTKEIAARYGARVHDFEWIFDFAAARNYSFSLATEEYILWLDADDRFLERDRKLFAELKATLDPEVDSVAMEYHLAFDAEGKPAAMAKRNRLVRRACGFKWHNPIHEYLEVDGNVYLTDIAVTHDRRGSHSARNLDIFKRIIEREGGLSGRNVLYYANELADSQQFKEAAETYELFLTQPDQYYEDYVLACSKLAECWHFLGDKERKLQSLVRIMAYDLPRADHCCAIGYCYQDKGDIKKAIFWYELALQLELPVHHFGVVNLIAWTWLPHLQLCICYGLLGELEKAYEHNEKALHHMPNDPNLLSNRAKLKEALEQGGYSV
ncbi:glycosyltransferase family 2 protein [Cohnella sp. AR92]|uniref:glycosyltransferase family 2 protein n=1 Tax=Cohnella sp. AR92 TaxID=648716 RepID=UPI000F8C5415|nr:glycosyltransferase family 2 protein [Cohnella sp. AR92]RUS46468.1 glycosyltransferase family 2 protein [Cohnella sp. AR92]